MDPAAVRILNILLGNSEGEAAVEMHFPAPTFAVESDCVAALAGADFDASVNGESVEPWRPFGLRRGDTLGFAKRSVGSRAYLAVAGGFAVAEWLGDKSTNLAAGIGGLEGRALRSGDVLGTSGVSALVKRFSISHDLIPRYSNFPTIRILPGPEFDLLTRAGKDTIENAVFSISPDSNRMGFRLAGDAAEALGSTEMVSSLVVFGTIQLLPGGQMVALMADHQTSGGYPRVATVITHDLPVMGQLSAGDKVAFRIVDLVEAESLLADFERSLALLRVACAARAAGN